MNVTSHRIIACVLCGSFWACQPATETVTQTDEFNYRITFQRDKKKQTKEGLYQRFSPAGVLVEASDYQNDSLHGMRRYYYDNGRLQSEEGFERGLNHGHYRKYDENGSLVIEQNYIHGAMEGNSVRYYPNGKVMEVVAIVHNEENGPFKEYYENGQIKAEGTYIYQDDAAVEQGELREYDSVGVLIRIADCEAGICRTRWRKSD